MHLIENRILCQVAHIHMFNGFLNIYFCITSLKVEGRYSPFQLSIHLDLTIKTWFDLLIIFLPFFPTLQHTMKINILQMLLHLQGKCGGKQPCFTLQKTLQSYLTLNTWRFPTSLTRLEAMEDKIKAESYKSFRKRHNLWETYKGPSLVGRKSMVIN